MSNFSLGFGTGPDLVRPGTWLPSGKQDMHPSQCRVDVVDLETAAAHETAWQALVTQAIEPDVFAEPGFLLTAARHTGPASRPLFALAWQARAGEPEALIGLCPLRPVTSRLAGHYVEVWSHKQGTTSTPLLHRDHAHAAFGALLRAVSSRWPQSGTLKLSGLALDGPLGSMLRALPGLRFTVLDQRTRAVLSREGASGAAVQGGSQARQAKELRRQRRRLEEEGRLAFRSAVTAEEIRVATEQFMELEARGWKGTRKTAFMLDPALAAFARTVTRLMAREGKCRIDTLALDGHALAMGIVLSSGNRSYFWKTAYDESRARRSPGKQFTSLLTDHQLADPTIALTDSCAAPDHPMIDRLWRERMAVGDVLVSDLSVPEATFAAVARRIATWRGLRLRAKDLLTLGRAALAKLAAEKTRAK